MPLPLRTSLLALSVVLASCSAAATAPSSEAEAPTDPSTAETRTIEHVGGVTEVPVDLQRIVTLQDQNALLPLLELGVTPVGSAALDNGDGTHTFRRVDAYDADDILYVGPYGEPDLERVAAAQPDLIVGNEGDLEIYDELSTIAPTVLIQIFDRPFVAALEEFAVLVDEDERFEQLRADYEQAVADLIDDLPRAPEDIVVSNLSFGTGEFYVSPEGAQAVGTVLADVGLARPEPQAGLEEFATFSFEQLTEHDGDVLLVPDFAGDEREEESPEIAAAREEPVFDNLDVVQRGELHVFDGTASVGSPFEKMINFVDVLRAVLVEREPTFADGR